MLINRPPKVRKPTPWPADKPKPKLIASVIPRFYVHCADLEDYLYQVYRMHLNFHQTVGLKKGTIVFEIQVKAALPDAWGIERTADQVRLGQYTRDIQTILNVLCLDGFIPAGTYVIDTRPRPALIAEYREILYLTENPLDPRCLSFKNQHKADRDFQHEATKLDKAVTEWLKSQQNHV